MSNKRKKRLPVVDGYELLSLLIYPTASRKINGIIRPHRRRGVILLAAVALAVKPLVIESVAIPLDLAFNVADAKALVADNGATVNHAQWKR